MVDGRDRDIVEALFIVRLDILLLVMVMCMGSAKLGLLMEVMFLD